MAINTERVTQCERNNTTLRMCNGCSIAEGLLSFVTVEQIALEIQDRACANDVGIQIVKRQEGGHTEVRIHGALRIGCHRDDATTSRNVRSCTATTKVDTNRCHVRCKLATQIVVGHFADECNLSAKAGDAGQSVGARTTAGACGLSHRCRELHSTVSFDKGHRALDHVICAKERIVHHGDHVDKGIAHTDDVVLNALFIGESGNVGGEWMTAWHGRQR